MAVASSAEVVVVVENVFRLVLLRSDTAVFVGTRYEPGPIFVLEKRCNGIGCWCGTLER
jgi:hypothetical protein